jgi:hypothetical protein
MRIAFDSSTRLDSHGNFNAAVVVASSRQRRTEVKLVVVILRVEVIILVVMVLIMVLARARAALPMEKEPFFPVKFSLDKALLHKCLPIISHQEAKKARRRAPRMIIRLSWEVLLDFPGICILLHSCSSRGP